MSFNRSAIEKDNRNGFWSVQGGAVSLGCLAMPNSRLKTLRDEFLTSIEYYDGFYVNLLFDRFYRPMCTHMGNRLISQ